MMPRTAVVSTSPNRGAIAVVSVTDSRFAEVLHGLFQTSAKSIPVGRVVFGKWGSDEPREDVVVCRLSDTEWEIHCHGGRAASSRILEELRNAGLQMVEPASLQCDVTSALTHAITTRSAAWIARQLDGRFDERIAEAETLIATGKLTSAREALQELERWSSFGQHLTEPWKVVIAGRPNVGKSTLMNAIAGHERAIVSDVPGTTRDVVSTVTAIDGWPITLEDTAGLRQAEDSIEQQGVQKTKSRMAEADLVVVVLDGSELPTASDRTILSENARGIVVLNKSDQPCRWQPLPALSVSALTGEGVDVVMREIVQRLVPEEPPAEQAMPVTEQQISRLKSVLASSHTAH